MIVKNCAQGTALALMGAYRVDFTHVRGVYGWYDLLKKGGKK